MSSDGTVRMVRAGNRAPREYETTAVLTLRARIRATSAMDAGRLAGWHAQAYASHARLPGVSVRQPLFGSPCYTIKAECTGLPSRLAVLESVLTAAFGR